MTPGADKSRKLSLFERLITLMPLLALMLKLKINFSAIDGALQIISAASAASDRAFDENSIYLEPLYDKDFVIPGAKPSL